MLEKLPADIIIYIGIDVNDCRILLKLIQTHPSIRMILMDNLPFIIKQMEKKNKTTFKELSMILSYCYIKSPSFESFLNICNYFYINTFDKIKQRLAFIATANINEPEMGLYLQLCINEKLYHDYAMSFMHFTQAQIDIVMALIKRGISYDHANAVADIYRNNPNVLDHFNNIVGTNDTVKKYNYALQILQKINEPLMSRYYYLADKMREENIYFLIRACMLTTEQFDRMEMIVRDGLTYDGIKLDITYDIAAFIVFTNLNQEQMHIIFKIGMYSMRLIQKIIEGNYDIYTFRGDGLHQQQNDEEDDDEYVIPMHAVITQSENNLHPSFYNILRGLENDIDENTVFSYFYVFSTVENIELFKSLILQGFMIKFAANIVRSGHQELLEHIMFFVNRGVEKNIAFLLGDARAHTHTINERHSMLMAQIFAGFEIPSDVDITESRNIISATKPAMFKYNLSMLSGNHSFIPKLEILIRPENEIALNKLKEYIFYTPNPLTYLFDPVNANIILEVCKKNLDIKYAFELLHMYKTTNIKIIQMYCFMRENGCSINLANQEISPFVGRRPFHRGPTITWMSTHFYEVKRLVSMGISSKVAEDCVVAFDAMEDKRPIDIFMSCIDMFTSLGLNKTIEANDIKLFIFIIKNTPSFEKAFDIFKNITPTMRQSIKNVITVGWTFKYIFHHFKISLI